MNSRSNGSYTPIGFVHSPYIEKDTIPKGPGAQHDAEGVMEIRPSLGLTVVRLIRRICADQLKRGWMETETGAKDNP